MPPFLPAFSISRSQSVRLGRGPGNQNVPELNSGDIAINPQTGALIGPQYVDLGNPYTRRDYQRHQAMGALIDVGSTSNTVYSDLFGTGFAVTNGSGFTLNVAAGVIQSRYSGAQIAVPATTVTTPGAPLFGTRNDLVIVNNAGVVSLLPGPMDTVAPTYDVVTVSSSAAITGGTFKVGFTYNGFWFTTAALANTTTGAQLATAMLAATGGPNNAALSAYAPSAVAGLSATGAGLSTGAVNLVVTAAGGLEGPLQNVTLLNNTATGGTLSLVHTTSGVGAQGFGPNGGYLILASSSTAVGASSATLSGATLMMTS
jgi:hypothetical protein